MEAHGHGPGSSVKGEGVEGLILRFRSWTTWLAIGLMEEFMCVCVEGERELLHTSVPLVE